MKENPNLQGLIEELKHLGTGKKVNLWNRLASDLSKPTRRHRAVNLSRINRFSAENETVVVPGKVLGAGPLNHKLTIAAFSFSQGALEKIDSVKGTAMHIRDLMKQDIKGKKVKVIG